MEAVPAAAAASIQSELDIGLALVADLGSHDLITVAQEDKLVEKLLAGDSSVLALAKAYASSTAVKSGGGGGLDRAARMLVRYT